MHDNKLVLRRGLLKQKTSTQGGNLNGLQKSTDGAHAESAETPITNEEQSRICRCEKCANFKQLREPILLEIGGKENENETQKHTNGTNDGGSKTDSSSS